MPNFVFEFWGIICWISERAFPRPGKRLISTPDLSLTAETFRRYIRSEEFARGRWKTITVATWLPKDPFQQALKGSKETGKNLAFSLDKTKFLFKMKFPAIQFKISLFYLKQLSFPSHSSDADISVGPLVARKGNRSKPNMEKVEFWWRTTCNSSPSEYV